MAKRKKGDVTFSGGLESTLDTTAAIALVFGLVIACISIVLFRLLGLVPALCIVLCTWVVWALLKSMAEIIRLLKMQAGLDYSGKISKARSSATYRCGSCGALLHSQARCDVCASEIESDE